MTSPKIDVNKKFVSKANSNKKYEVGYKEVVEDDFCENGYMCHSSYYYDGFYKKEGSFNVNEEDSPILIAIQEGNVDIIRLLLEKSELSVNEKSTKKSKTVKVFEKEKKRKVNLMIITLFAYIYVFNTIFFNVLNVVLFIKFVFNEVSKKLFEIQF